MLRIFTEGEQARKRWIYIGDSEITYNDSYDLGTISGFFCYPGGSDEILNRLESERPAVNYPIGYIIRVGHRVTGPPGSGGIDCGYQYYQVIAREWKEYDYLLPYTVNKKKDEDLDNAVVSRYTRENEILPPLTKIQLVEFDETTHWVVAKCEMERVSVNLWKQTIELLNPIEILKGYPLDNITVTQPINPDASHPIMTLADVIDRLIDIAVTHRNDESGLKDYLSLDSTTRSRLSRIESPEFAFTEMTLFDALIEIGVYLDAMPKIRFNEEGTLILYFESLDIENKNNYIIENLQTEIKQHSLSNYADAVVSTVSNLHTGSPVIYPGADMFVYVDSGENIEITNDNARLTLPYRIKKIVKFEIRHIGITADYTHYVYEEGFWNLLHPIRYGDDAEDIPDYQRKPNTVHYRYNSNVIEFGKNWIQMPAIRATLFRITFIPIYDTKIVQTSVSVDQPKYAVISNQNENIVDGDAFAIKLRNYLKRMRYGDYYISKKYRRFQDIPEIGHMVNGKYVITNVSYTKYPTYYDVVLHLSEGYTRRAEFIRAKQEIRSWEIPADGKVINRLINYREKVKFSLGYPIDERKKTAPSIVSVWSIFPVIADVLIPGMIAAINFETKEGIIPAIMTTVISAVGQSLTFNFKALDNTLLGFSKALRWDNSVRMQQGVTYTDSYGNVERATIGFVKSIDSSLIIDLESLSRNYPMSTIQQNEELLEQASILINDLVIRKDAREILNFTYQIETQGVNETIVHQNLAKYALGQQTETDDGQTISIYLFFLNKKIYSDTEQITSADIIKRALVVTDISGNNKITYTLWNDTPPSTYEALAIGAEITPRNTSLPSYDRILFIQNNITPEIKNRLENEGKIDLYYNV